MGKDISEFKNDQTPEPLKSFFKLEFDDFLFDILPEIKANIKFNEANKRKETVDLGKIQIHFINFSDLIEDKEATARNKDLDDINQLKKAIRKNN